jgi:hypothetical protein
MKRCSWKFPPELRLVPAQQAVHEPTDRVIDPFLHDRRVLVQTVGGVPRAANRANCSWSLRPSTRPAQRLPEKRVEHYVGDQKVLR